MNSEELRCRFATDINWGLTVRWIYIEITRRGRRDSPSRGNVARRQRGNGEAVTYVSFRFFAVAHTGATLRDISI